MAEPHHSPEGGALNAAISQTVVRLMADASGRGPTKARTTIDRDLIVVVLQNSLTSGERYLATATAPNMCSKRVAPTKTP